MNRGFTRLEFVFSLVSFWLLFGALLTAVTGCSMNERTSQDAETVNLNWASYLRQ